jgi:hypothetical protein
MIDTQNFAKTAVPILLAAACAAQTPARQPPPAAPTGFVKVTEVPDYQGQATFKIETGQGSATEVTYYYHKVGAGFASIIDRDGKDWIAWRSGDGPDGEYRGIPNLGLERCCHPGYGVEGKNAALVMESTLVEQSAKRAVIRSVGCEGFEVTWTFAPTHATLKVVQAPKTYWFLYEGTPGGAIEEGDEIVLVATGEKIPVADGKYEVDMPDPEWVYFADSVLDRSLFFAHHESDDLRDIYYRMGTGTGGMTVWGFGRGPGVTTLLSGTHHLTIGLIESRDLPTIKAAIAEAVRSLP